MAGLFEQHRIEGAEYGSVAEEGRSLLLRAGPRTDWFVKPDGSNTTDNVIRLIREVDAPVFALSAKVTVDFAATYDAGALLIEVNRDHWAKLAFERSAAGEATAVSVVTRGTSDDADGPVHDADHVWLRLYCDGRIIAFHHSVNGRFWRFLRLFTLPDVANRPVRIGLCAQSPMGEGTTAIFSDVHLSFDTITNMRDGS